MKKMLFLVCLLLFIPFVFADNSTCGVTYDTLNGGYANQSNIAAVTKNETNLTWSKVENLVSQTPPTNTSFADPSCTATNPFLRSSPDLSVFLEFLQTAYWPQYSFDIVVTNDHTVHLARDPVGLQEIYLYSYDTFTGAFECGINFTYSSTVNDYVHEGYGDYVYIGTLNMGNGVVSALSVDLVNCTVNWAVAHNTSSFIPDDLGDIAVNGNYVEVWLGRTSSSPMRFLDIQYNRNTGALNRGVVINATNNNARPAGIVIDSATGNAYASGISNAYAIMVQINGTSPGATIAAKRLARHDQNAVNAIDREIFFCNGGNSVCASIDYSYTYGRLFVVNMTPFNETREFITSSSGSGVEVYGIYVDPAYDNYVNVYGTDYNNNQGYLSVVNANTGAIPLDITLTAMTDIGGVATSGDFASGNLISAIGGDWNTGIGIVQQFNSSSGSVVGFNLTYSGAEYGTDVKPTSDPNQFVGFAKDNTPRNTITFLFGPYQAPTPDAVPEFSLATLLLAVLLAGGLVLFVVRRKP